MTSTPTSTIQRTPALLLCICLFTTLGAMDVPLTLAGLAHGGHELNPVAREILAHGPIALALVRVVALLGAGLTLALLASSASRTAIVCATTLVALFGAVDLFSIFQLVTL